MAATPVFMVNVATLVQYDGSNMADILALLDPNMIASRSLTLSSDSGGTAVLSGDYVDEGMASKTWNTGDWVDLGASPWPPYPIPAEQVATYMRPYVPAAS